MFLRVFIQIKHFLFTANNIASYICNCKVVFRKMQGVKVRKNPSIPCVLLYKPPIFSFGSSKMKFQLFRTCIFCFRDL